MRDPRPPAPLGDGDPATRPATVPAPTPRSSPTRPSAGEGQETVPARSAPASPAGSTLPRPAGAAPAPATRTLYLPTLSGQTLAVEARPAGRGPGWQILAYRLALEAAGLDPATATRQIETALRAAFPGRGGTAKVLLAAGDDDPAALRGTLPPAPPPAPPASRPRTPPGRRARRSAGGR